MCGISAVFSKSGQAENRLPAMNAIQRHRGPDGEGDWVSADGRVGFGHRRLAVLDLTATGRQPMHGADGVVIVFNGEIYNYRELRAELAGLGRTFVSTGDTEVILAAYAEWGEACVKRLNGMWAFAIYDPAKRKIFLSRDRLGMKPLYLAASPDGVVFASEVKAILAAGHRAAVDPDALAEYFTFQNVISMRTLFSGVEMVPPGHNLWVDTETGAMRRERFWRADFSPVAGTDGELADELLRIFRSSMDRHMRSEVEVGATLSGGMDSSAIVALAAGRGGAGLHTFTGFFNTRGVDADDRSVNEQDDARLIARHFGTMHHEREIMPQDVITTLPSIVWHLEDPKVGMCYTFHAMSQLVGSWVTVNLSGTGGDELFAGYPWRYALVEGLEAPAAFDEVYFNWWSRLVKPADHEKLFTKKIRSGTEPSLVRAAYAGIMQGADGLAPLNRALHFDMATFLHGFLLVEDKLGMAYGLETRFPFLDAELVEFATRVPPDQKIRGGVAKYLLKEAFRPLLPPETLFKRKQGFTPPDKTWMRRELASYVERLLLSRRSCIGEYVERDFIRATLDRHARGSDERLLIWSMMFFEGWCRVYLGGEREPAAISF